MRLTAEQVAFLEGRRVAYLGTVDARGRPHVVPVCFACVDGRVYTPIDEKPKTGRPDELRRLRNLRVNPEVCLTIDVYDDDWSRLAWCQVRGQGRLVDDPLERSAAIDALRRRYPQYREMGLEHLPLVRVEPERVVTWAARPGGTP